MPILQYLTGIVNHAMIENEACATAMRAALYAAAGLDSFELRLNRHVEADMATRLDVGFNLPNFDGSAVPIVRQAEAWYNHAVADARPAGGALRDWLPGCRR